MSKYIHAIHDPHPAELHGDKPGWVIITEAIGADPNDHAGVDYRQWADHGITPIVRLNNGYGKAGTIPLPGRYPDFARRVANFIANSRGCTRYIIGNEPNHSQERPDGQPIRSRMYADCFLQCAEAVRQRGGNVRDLIVAPVAPWNMETGDWVRYWRDVLERVGDVAGGLALHTYTHGPDPWLIGSDVKMAAPFADRHFHFRAYRDLLAAVPAELRHLPVYITEANQDDPWLDQNNGWVQAAYAEIDAWNQQPGTQKIHCLALYRWPKYDQWSIEDKPQVQAMFREVAARGYKVPDKQNSSPTALEKGGYSSYFPIVAGGGAGQQPPPTPLDWDERLTARGVRIETPQLKPGDKYLAVVRGRWYNEQEANRAGPNRHILVDLLDENGQRVVGQHLSVNWPSGSARIVTEAKPGERWSSNYPMTASRNDFTIQPTGWLPAEKVVGIGMGEATPDGGYNAGIHTSTELVWQVARYAGSSVPEKPDNSQPQPEQPKPQPPETGQPTPALIWPTDAPRTQRWGENPAFYQRALGIPYHNGIDHGAAAGTPVRAMADGEVMFVGTDPGYGNYVRLFHAALGIHTFVAHLQRAVVSVGQRVKQGQVIAYSGASGLTAASIQGDQADTSRPAPHTHTEIRLGERDAYADGTFGHSNGRIDPEAAMYLINRIQRGPDTARAGGGSLDPVTLLAFLNVESNAQPFTDGRLTIRFEVHRFAQFLGDQALFIRHFKYVPNAYNEQHWRENPDAPWRHAHGDMSARHELLRFARSLDDTAALNSTGMGMGQIMGHNAAKAGFDSPQTMFKLFSHPKYGPAAQILGMVNFIRSNPALSDALARRDWYKAVQLYNGVGQEAEYVRRLDDALAEIEAV